MKKKHDMTVTPKDIAAIHGQELKRSRQRAAFDQLRFLDAKYDHFFDD